MKVLPRHIIFPLCMIGFVIAVQSQTPCPSNWICVKWDKVTQYDDNTNIPASRPVTYNLWMDAKPYRATDGLSMIVKDAKNGNHCIFVTASALSPKSPTDPTLVMTTSGPSAEGCKVVRVSAPTNGAIEAPTNGAIEVPVTKPKK